MKLKRDIVIPAGTEVIVANWSVRHTDTAQALVALDKDGTGSFTMPVEDALRLGLVEEE